MVRVARNCFPMGMMISFVTMCFFASALAFPGNSHPQDKIAELQQKYDKETNPVHKAKALVKLGEAQISYAAQISEAHDYAGALAQIQKYRDEVRETYAALAATGIDPVKKPDGFQQLEMSLRENLRQVRDIVMAAPAMQEDSFRSVMQELETENEKLLAELFGPSPKPDGQSAPSHPGTNGFLR